MKLSMSLPRRHRSIALAYVLLIVLVIVSRIEISGFLGVDHIDELIDTGALMGFVALGQGFVILAGGVDLSIPWVVTASGILLSSWAGTNPNDIWWAVPLVLGLAAVVGLINGFGIVFLGVPAIIMTLGMYTTVEGVLLLYTNGNAGGAAPSAAIYLADHKWGEVPVMGVAWLVLIVIITFVLSWTPFGRRLYAVGLNRRVALFSGVNVKLETMAVYVISSVAAGFAGIALAGYVGTTYLGMGDPYLFTSVAAVAIGGAALLGGTGNYIGTVAGALTLSVLNALLPGLGFQPAVLDIVYGVVILIAVAAASIGARAGGRTMPKWLFVSWLRPSTPGPAAVEAPPDVGAPPALSGAAATAANGSPAASERSAGAALDE
jgi:ribose transport system permease protein